MPETIETIANRVADLERSIADLTSELAAERDRVVETPPPILHARTQKVTGATPAYPDPTDDDAGKLPIVFLSGPEPDATPITVEPRNFVVSPTWLPAGVRFRVWRGGIDAGELYSILDFPLMKCRVVEAGGIAPAATGTVKAYIAGVDPGEFNEFEASADWSHDNRPYPNGGDVFVLYFPDDDLLSIIGGVC